MSGIGNRRAYQHPSESRASALTPLTGSPTESAIECTRAVVRLYQGWDKAEPHNAHDTELQSWKARLQELYAQGRPQESVGD